MATVFIPSRLRRLTDGLESVEVDGASVGALIDAIERRFPGFRAEVVVDDEIDPALAIAVDGEVLAGGLGEPVAASSEVHLIPALSGGAGDRP